MNEASFFMDYYHRALLSWSEVHITITKEQ
jgi:hypothetical protein